MDVTQISARFDQLNSSLVELKSSVDSFWLSPAFWIGTAIGIIGLVVSYGAYREAREAKRSSQKRNSISRLQFTVSDLNQIATRIRFVARDLVYDDAIWMFTDITSRIVYLKRIYESRNAAENSAVTQQCAKALETLKTIDTAIDGLRPTEEAQASNAIVYYSIDTKLTALSIELSELIAIIDTMAQDKAEE
jgi:hypothetical protein